MERFVEPPFMVDHGIETIIMHKGHYLSRKKNIAADESPGPARINSLGLYYRLMMAAAGIEHMHIRLNTLYDTGTHFN